MTWQISGPGQIYDAGEDSVVYFDSFSGDTHLVGAFASFIIEQLRKENMTLAALTERAEPLSDSESSSTLHDAISVVVTELEALGILEQV
jgi:PqqD family protein of HPr-rel-A system